MTGPVWSRKAYLTTSERAAVERVLRAAGYRPGANCGEWYLPRRMQVAGSLDLRDVFPTPFTAKETEPACTCLVDHVCDPNAESRCPVHGEAS